MPKLVLRLCATFSCFLRCVLQQECGMALSLHSIHASLWLCQLLSINGESTQGWDGARAAKFLRGKNGTVVTVKLARRSDQIPGVPGIPEPVPEVQYREVKMKRCVACLHTAWG